LKPAPSVQNGAGWASVLEALVYELLHRFLGVSGALLDSSHQLVFTAFLVSKVVVGELGVLLFEFSLGNVPIALDMKCVHLIFLFLFVSMLAAPSDAEHPLI
jgi:hypothetical protein